MSAGLTFSEAGHRYRLDGKPVRGVTTLIGGGLPKPALLKWAPRMVAEWVADHEDETTGLRAMGRGPMVQALAETPWAQRDAAGKRGSEIHDLAERLARGEEVDVPDEIAGYVSACLAFLEDFDVEPILIEAVVGHRAHWWAGKLDLVARFPDGKVRLCDYKSARSGIFGETALQLAAYSHAEFYVGDDGEEHPMPAIDECWGVHVREDGYTVIPVDGSDATYADFRHVGWVANFAAKRLKGLTGEPVDPPSGEAD